ncbi:polysaccharide lyase family 7 protein [Polaribacter sp. Z022]|uniref:polysaccharide lyase family 7 protein n=1 Tax=Polaribacter sp. Z022 TaxID=2927125 RepID=UPI0024C45439|nr:polysaccharide lyase family 7 protein [Polaribacter sp. Z022]
MSNCNQWKITYPNGSEVKTLCTEPSNEYFYVNNTGNAIVFRAPVRSDNGTTPNSSYIRSELRERETDGSKDIYWTTEGKHMVYVKQAITHLPINKSHLVATQIHGNKDDGIDDSMVLRLEDSHLFLSFNGGKLREDLTIKTNYILGTKHEVIFVVEDGKHYCYYSEDDNLLAAYNSGNADAYLVKDGENDFVMDLNYDETYFKIGNYTQSNAEKEGDDTDDPNNYGEVLVYDFSVVHDEVAVSGVSLSPSTVNLTQSSAYQLSAIVTPSNATNKGVTYSSSNTSVATVNETGVVTPISVGEAIITVTTKEGSFTDTSVITVIEDASGPNLALNKSITGTGTHHSDNAVENLVDGLTSTRWSVSGFPQSAIIDLGKKYPVERTEVVCYSDRAYKYSISISDTENGTYTEIVDRSNNTTEGTEASPIVDVFSGVEGQFIKITVTGAEGYTGSWVSLLELRVFEASTLNIESNILNNNTISLWPNPVKENLKISNIQDFNTLKIYDQLGKLIVSKSLKDENIDVSNLKSGLYIFSFSSGLGTVNKRVLKK